MSNVAIYTYLNEMMSRNATDIYMTVGVPPTLRVDNELVALSGMPVSDDDIQNLLNEVLTSRQRREFETSMELNVALDMGMEGRFRINVLRQKQHPAMVIRRITSRIPTFEDLKLPKALEKLSLEKRGLILVTGVTSSGKSTTLAAMIDYRNTYQGGHIITIEDPVEYFHEHKKGIITQREVGIDTVSYQVALKNALRQKPDVILVGEIRDTEVMEQTLGAAETGHLCLATLHTNNASQAVERIINFFPEEQHNQVRISLAMNLRAVMSQRLVAGVDGKLIVATEIMLNEALVRELILKGQTHKIRDVMAQNNSAGMVVFDQSLLKLYKDGRISEDVAIMESDIPADMKMRIQQHKLSKSRDGTSQIDTSHLSL